MDLDDISLDEHCKYLSDSRVGELQGRESEEEGGDWSPNHWNHPPLCSREGLQQVSYSIATRETLK